MGLGVNVRWYLPVHRVPRPSCPCSHTPGDPGLSRWGLHQRPAVALPQLESSISSLRAGSQVPKGPSTFPGTVTLTLGCLGLLLPSPLGGMECLQN